jgi:beta-glucanase (GH16 family)
MYSSNVSVTNGYLNLEASGAAGASGGIISSDPDDGQPGHTGYQYTYGFVEARIYLPASGTEVANWPAFWAVGQNWPVDGEMDVMEGLGGSACYHFHYGTSPSDKNGPGNCVSGNYTGWHTFGANWQPGVVTYYYDGVDVGQITTGITTEPMFLILENSTGTYGLLPVTTPSDMLVSYVRVWQ